MRCRAWHLAAFRNILLTGLLTGSVVTAHQEGRRPADAPTGPENAGAYDVVVETSQDGGGSTWRYTITKAGSDTKDLGHFIVNFNTCGDQSPALGHIVSMEWIGSASSRHQKAGLAVMSTQ
jgi:hypothetical protein